MVAASAQRLYTVVDLLTLPEPVGGHYELDEGSLVTVAGSSFKPSVVAAKVLSRIDGYADQNDLGFVCGADCTFVLATGPDTVHIPDVGFVKTARIPATGLPAGFWPGGPDLAVEVLSPSNARAAILKKIGEYLAAGTALVWVLDPDKRSAEVYCADAPPLVVGEGGELSGEDVLPGFTLRLSEIWV